MLKVAAVQFAARDDVSRNLDKAVELGLLAVERGAGLIAYPELCTNRWFPSRMRVSNFDLAETVPGPSTERMCRFAADNDAVVIFPLFEKAAGKKYHNSAVVIDAGGALLGVYRKIHIPNVKGWHEKFYFIPGDTGFPVFKTRVGKVGVQISWDAFFPEGSRILALSGAQIIVVPTSNAFASQSRWERMLAGNAIANGMFILRANRVGKEGSQNFYGKSFCLTPHGELNHRPAAGRDAVYLTEVDLREVADARSEWAFFRDRREDMYEGLLGRMPGADGLGLPAGGYGGSTVTEEPAK